MLYKLYVHSVLVYVCCVERNIERKHIINKTLHVCYSNIKEKKKKKKKRFSRHIFKYNDWWTVSRGEKRERFDICQKQWVLTFSQPTNLFVWIDFPRITGFSKVCLLSQSVCLTNSKPNFLVISNNETRVMIAIV